MKLFSKVALVSAIAISGQAMAMQAMDDSSLSAATGQDGITIALGLDHIAIGSLYVHDNDGLALVGTAAQAAQGTQGQPGYVAAVPASADYNGGTATAGAITIMGTGYTGTAPVDPGTSASQTDQDAYAAALATHTQKMRTATNGIDIRTNPTGGLVTFNGQNVIAKLDIDADAGTGANGAFLNVNAQVSGLDIAVGAIGVAKSNDKAAMTNARRGIVTGSNNAIINGLTLKTGQMSANVQLGATPQGAMVVMNGNMTGGLAIDNLEIKDNGAGGTVNIDSIKLTDATGANLSTNAKIGVTPIGLKIEAMATPTDAYVSGIHLGSAASASIGDIEVRDMAVSHGGTAGAVIFVQGH